MCLEFDDGVLDPVVHDGSVHATDADAAELAMESRPGSPHAAALAIGSHLHVPEGKNLDLGGRFTLELWTLLPTLQETSLLRNEGQYGLAIDAAGRLACSIDGRGTVTSPKPLTVSTWQHVACTYEMERVRLWIGGSLVACGMVGRGPIATAGAAGTTIGDSMTGAVDDIRVYGANLGPQLCAHAGATGCVATCPGVPTPPGPG